MRDVNAYLSELLAPLDLPCSEEPMLDNCPGGFITWKKLSDRMLYASGKPYLRLVRVTVMLWLPAAEDTQAIQERLTALLRGAGCKAAFLDATWVEAIIRRAVSVRCVLPPEVLP